jgi:hypothetical protein
MRRFFVLSAVCAIPAFPVDFNSQIAPLLESRCQVCHGAKQQMSGLRLDSAAAAAKVTSNGKLLERINSTQPGFRMPPVGAPLGAGEIAAFEAWIAEGAKWPVGYAPGRASLHWSFRPVSSPTPPAVRKEGWVHNPIDRFILANLEKQNIQSSKEASKLVLLRRVTFDLTGLPPTPSEVSDYLNDTRSDAYAQLVDRLLASRHYGERFARPWLDLAHYATATATKRIANAPTPGATATTSLTPSIATSPSINSPSSNWPATCSPNQPWNNLPPPVSCAPPSPIAKPGSIAPKPATNSSSAASTPSARHG